MSGPGTPEPDSEAVAADVSTQLSKGTENRDELPSVVAVVSLEFHPDRLTEPHRGRGQERHARKSTVLPLAEGYPKRRQANLNSQHLTTMSRDGRYRLQGSTRAVPRSVHTPGHRERRRCRNTGIGAVAIRRRGTVKEWRGVFIPFHNNLHVHALDGAWGLSSRVL